MLLGLPTNLWATSDGIFESVKEDVNPGTMNVGLVKCTNNNIANARKKIVETNRMNEWSE